MDKRLQARVIEACVESSLLFDCQVRTWTVGEIKRMQKFVDKAYRYVWRRGDRAPLVQMQEEGVNMVDVRRELRVRSWRWKNEKRCLERIGHVLRMRDDRMVKAVVLGWMKNLEVWPKCKGRSRKTILYWRKLVKEAGWDYTRIAGYAAARGEWKKKVMERMEHVEQYEWSKGKRWDGEEMERNVFVV